MAEKHEFNPDWYQTDAQKMQVLKDIAEEQKETIAKLCAEIELLKTRPEQSAPIVDGGEALGYLDWVIINLRGMLPKATMGPIERRLMFVRASLTAPRPDDAYSVCDKCKGTGEVGGLSSVGCAWCNCTGKVKRPDDGGE